MAEGTLFPSAVERIVVTGIPNVQFENAVMQAFADADACDEMGVGRQVQLNETVYTVSACDIMQGHLVVVFQPTDGEIIIISQTFGPMAYTVVLITCLICIYGASALEQTAWQKYLTWAVSAAGTLACCILYQTSGILFLTTEDEIHFWMSIIGTCFIITADMVVTYYARNDTNNKLLMQHVKGIDLCIYMLGSITDCLYRSPETPYASLFVIALAIRAWQKIYTLCFDLKEKNSVVVAWLLHVKLIYNLVYMCLTVEVGLICQFNERDDWPIYAGIGALATFLAAWSARMPVPVP
jgi:hypothetical protein